MTLEEARLLFADDLFATKQCGIRIDSLTQTEACLSMPITQNHMNSNGVVQGGAIYTLCDTAFAVAANAQDIRVVNRSAEITYLKPGRGSRLVAKAKCISRGSTMGLYQVEVLDDENVLIAFMTVNGFAKA